MTQQFLSFLIKLTPAGWQKHCLLTTIKTVNSACNSLSGFALEERAFTRTALSKRQYMMLRHQMGLPAALVQSAIYKVSNAYTNQVYRKRSKPLFFSATSAIIYDRRGCTITPNEIRLRVLDRRLSVPFKCSPRMPEGWEKRWVSAQLVYRKKEFYLRVVVPVDCATSPQPSGVLGVDLGVVNLAVDSDGELYAPGNKIPAIRQKYAQQRCELQKKAAEKRKSGVRPRSVIRKLRALSGKERRWVTNLLHCAAKRLVTKARGTNRAIALEDLKGIREKHRKPHRHGETAMRRQSRHQINAWPYSKFGQFVVYKARLMGVVAVIVPPHATSTTCPVCGVTNKKNRKSRDEFCCVACGYSGPADHIAAINISRRGAGMLIAAGSPLPAYSVTPLVETPREGKQAQFR